LVAGRTQGIPDFEEMDIDLGNKPFENKKNTRNLIKD